jgi:hypothetical protein
VWFLGFALCFCGWGGGAIALHQVTQNLGAGGTIFSVQVALLFVSNYAFERNGGLRDQLCLKVQGRPLNLKPLDSIEAEVSSSQNGLIHKTLPKILKRCVKLPIQQCVGYY